MNAAETGAAGETSRVCAGAIAAVGAIDAAITAICRLLVLVTGIALTVVMTVNVAARYVFTAGGFGALQELPERLFPWFIAAGIALAAQAGGHMAVDWSLDKLEDKGKRILLLFGNAIVIGSYAVLCYQAFAVAEIAKIERSPVLSLSGSHGYWAIAFACVMLVLTHLCASVRIALLGPQSRFTIAYKEL